MKRLGETDEFRRIAQEARAERIEFVVGGIEGAAKVVDEGFRDSSPGARQQVASNLRYFAAELQTLANAERRNGGS